jgi:surface protein
MAYTVTFNANGSTFENSSTTNTMSYSSDYKLVTKYSHTDNISDDGTQNSNYGNNEAKTEVVTIDGATSLTVTVTYGGESASYDWVSIFSGSHPTYTASSNYSSADIVQQLGGGSHTSQTKTYTVSGDSVTFAWKSDSSGYGDGYGYYAVVTAPTGTVTGTYAKPTVPEGKKFIGWSTDKSAAEATYARDGSDIPTDQNLTLYAVYTNWQWCDDWDYKLDSTEKTIWIYKYNGKETDYTVPASATIDGVTYTTKIGYNEWNGDYYGAIGGIYQTWHFPLDTGTITNISFQKGVVISTSLKNLFVSKSSKLTSIDLSNLDTSKVTSMSGIFSGCSNLTSLDLSNFNTNNVEEMDRMFAGCESLVSLNLSIFNTGQVNNMAFMFCNCSKLTNLNISNFNTSKVTYMSYMFDNCSNLIELDLSNFDTNKVTTMYAMFYGCGRLRNLNISSFNTSSVKNMSLMFSGCSSLTSLGVSNFDTSQVTNMNYMFRGCSSLTSLDVSNFDTSKVTNMSSMFNNCSSLTSLDLSNFDTSNVTDMSNMFFKSSSTSSIINISN